MSNIVHDDVRRSVLVADNSIDCGTRAFTLAAGVGAAVSFLIATVLPFAVIIAHKRLLQNGKQQANGTPQSKYVSVTRMRPHHVSCRYCVATIVILRESTFFKHDVTSHVLCL